MPTILTVEVTILKINFLNTYGIEYVRYREIIACQLQANKAVGKWVQSLITVFPKNTVSVFNPNLIPCLLHFYFGWTNVS